MKKKHTLALCGGLLAAAVARASLAPASHAQRAQPAQGPKALRAEAFRPLVEEFNADDRELVATSIPNARAWEYLSQNIPLFECPDKEIEKTYYFRWWTFRKHLRTIADGRTIVTEFLPDVPWAGKFNSISCGAAHHIAEGRWLHDAKPLDDYSKFWFQEGEPRRYSFPVADALWRRYQVTGQREPMTSLLPDLVKNYAAWEREKQDKNGLYWQVDDRDGMEVSVGGSGYRATINSYQYADARAISQIASLAKNPNLAQEFGAKAESLRASTCSLWNEGAQFFETITRNADGTAGKSVNVREQHGYVPWLYGIPQQKHLVAWKQLTDEAGFKAPFGPTTAERRSPGFQLSYGGHECQWNGPSWPFATSQTLTALANVLNGPPTDAISKADYLALLRGYALSHRKKNEAGKTVCWIDENLNPDTGDWISRTMLLQRAGGKPEPGGLAERGKDYNHSTFCDLVISGLVGLRPRADGTLEVNPLFPATWKYAALDNVAYHGQKVAVFWDANGTRYGWGRGLSLIVNGKKVAQSLALARLTASIPATPQVKVAPPPQPALQPANLAQQGAGSAAGFPKLSASFTSQYDKLEQANDGVTSQGDNPRSRWTAFGSPNASDWLEVDFGKSVRFDTVVVDLFEDGGAVRVPREMRVELWEGAKWSDSGAKFAEPLRAGPNTLRLPAASASKVRVVLAHAAGLASGVTELQVFDRSPQN